MNKIKIVKFAVGIMSGAGASHIVDGIVKSNVNLDDLNSFGKVQLAMGRVALGTMAAYKTREFTNTQIDELVANWNDAKSKTETTTQA